MSTPVCDLLTETEDAWDKMLEACRSAQRSIEIEEYIFKVEGIGAKFIRTLVEKAREGVSVRLLLDWWGCREISRKGHVNTLESAGVEVRFFRPPEWSWLSKSPRFLPRDHRKVMIVDGKTAFIGGVCINEAYRDWRDTMVKVTGHLVDEISHVFEKTWLKTVGDETEIKSNPDLSSRADYAVYVNAPEAREYDFINLLRSKISNAKTTIRLASPYFVPDRPFIKSLIDASDRGVEVELLLSRYSKYSAFVVGKLLCKDLLKAGVKIHYYDPRMLHLKKMLIDDNWAAIGSCNLDGLSLHHNQEIMLTSLSSEFVEALLKNYFNDLAQSTRLTHADWRRRPLKQKISGALFYPFKHYL